jgi:hypothetical protein
MLKRALLIRGTHMQATPAMYTAAVHALQPDLWVTLCDEVCWMATSIWLHLGWGVLCSDVFYWALQTEVKRSAHK